MPCAECARSFRSHALNKMIIIAGAAVVLLGGGAGGLFATGMLDPLLGKEEAGHDEEAAAKAKEVEEAHEAIYVELAPMMAPVIVGSRVKQQVMLTMSLQVSDIAAKNDLTRIMPKLRDAMLSELYDKPLIRNDSDGTLNIRDIKMRLLQVTHGLLKEKQVQDVLIVRASLTG